MIYFFCTNELEKINFNGGKWIAEGNSHVGFKLQIGRFLPPLIENLSFLSFILVIQIYFFFLSPFFHIQMSCRHSSEALAYYLRCLASKTALSMSSLHMYGEIIHALRKNVRADGWADSLENWVSSSRKVNKHLMYVVYMCLWIKIFFFLKKIDFFGRRKTEYVTVHGCGPCLLWMRKKSTVYLLYSHHIFIYSIITFSFVINMFLR